MKEYCVDLKIAKELKENGFPQDSEFYFMRQDAGTIDTKNGGLSNRKPWALSGIVSKKDKEDFLENFGHKDKWMGIQPESFLSAPLPGEILKELPKSIVNGIYWMFIIKDFDNNFQVYYENTYINELKFRIINKKLSNCLALAWLHLKKLGYIK